MTEEKKKALDLVDKFCVEINCDSLISDLTKHQTMPRAKECALICVDEIIKNAPSESLVISVETIETAYKQTIQNKEFWQNVKKEIEKL